MPTTLYPDLNSLITADLDRSGWSVTPQFLGCEEARALAGESQAAWEAGAFHRARVGRGSDLAIREDIRKDQVVWLRPGETTEVQSRYLGLLGPLRLAINEKFFLGLFDFEGHFAVYPEGAFYQPHLDRHRQTADRVVTVILYLNGDWMPGDGGELKLWTTPGHNGGPFEIIEPRLGTLVVFFAADHWHEVLPARRTRMSITGWFRVRA